MQTLKELLSQSVFTALVWAGYWYGIEGAQNVASFLIWAMLPLSMFLLTESSIASTARKPRLGLRRLRRAISAITIAMVAWVGAPWTAAAMLIVFALGMAHTDMADKKRGAKACA